MESGLITYNGPIIHIFKEPAGQTGRCALSFPQSGRGIGGALKHGVLCQPVLDARHIRSWINVGAMTQECFEECCLRVTVRRAIYGVPCRYDNNDPDCFRTSVVKLACGPLAIAQCEPHSYRLVDPRSEIGFHLPVNATLQRVVKRFLTVGVYRQRNIVLKRYQRHYLVPNASAHGARQDK